MLKKRFMRLAAISLLAAPPAMAQLDLPIHDAARMGTGAEVSRLIKADPKLRDARNHIGATPLHLAATNSDPSAIKALVAAGADPNARDHEGTTPLHFAAYANRSANARLLLEAGADPKSKTNTGRDATSVARKMKNDEAAGVISLWMLKGCKPGKPC